MVRIQSLEPADELLCWMRLGLALYIQREANGKVIRVVPRRPRASQNGDIANFTGWVVRNEPENTRIVLVVMDMNAYYRGVDGLGQYEATIPYHAFKRVERLSKVNFPGKANPMIRPTKSGFHRPYRTREEVRLT